MLKFNISRIVMQFSFICIVTNAHVLPYKHIFKLIFTFNTLLRFVLNFEQQRSELVFNTTCRILC